ncbi:MAG: sulfite exporter TauE/SafE family protein [Cyanobacteria bacterium P01_A01_bin.45]
MIDLFLIATLGFLGSFGHCLGMCGPLTVAFSLSRKQRDNWYSQIRFHFLLNLGRIISYALIGAGIGALGSVLLAGGEFAGVGSSVRQWMAIITGLMLIWFGLRQIKPDLLPSMPFLHPFLKNDLHNRLNAGMMNLSTKTNWWIPGILGMTWGLMPCGFLYTAQIKAAETGSLWMGTATMLAFGTGTLPMMMGVGISASSLSKDKRSQLFRMGGWVTLTIGIITLLRTGDTMVDYTGHAALILLIMSLIARPISSVWAAPLRYRRALGVGAFILSGAHIIHMVEHSLEWNLGAILFFPQEYQWGVWGGAIAFVLMTPAALTSFDSCQKYLGKWWRKIHLLSLPALGLSIFHAVVIGSHYLGTLQGSWVNKFAAAFLIILGLSVLLIRNPLIWSILGLKRFYTSEYKSK